MQIRFILFVTLFVASASIGCETSVGENGIGFSVPYDPDIIYFHSIYAANDRSSLLTTMERAAPKGTPISEAEELMENAGFRCKHYTHASFRESEDSSGVTGQHRFVEDADYLLCVLPSETAASHDHNWTIAILYDGRRRIYDILVRDDSQSFQSKQAEPGDEPKSQ